MIHTTAAPARAESISRMLADAEALLIDFNGTLSDDEELIRELVTDIAGEHLRVDLDRSRYYAELVGRTEESMFQVLSGSSDPRRVGSLVDLFNRRYLERVHRQRRIAPAAEAFVWAAHDRGTPIAVVTAASKTVAVPALSQIELLDAIDVVVALEDVEHAKPDPACYLLALDLLGVDADRALAFEDSSVGLASAQAAGLRVIGVGPATALTELTPYAAAALDPALYG